MNNYRIVNHDKNIVEIIISNPLMRVHLLNIGASIYKIETPDKSNTFENIVLSYKNVDDYLVNDIFLATTVGRVAGRIENGEFVLNNKKHTIEKNNGMNNLHSGMNGFHKVFFDYEVIETNEGFNVIFSKKINAGVNGDFPGNLDVKIKYIIIGSTLKIEYEVNSDEDTLCNVTNHSYFNLSGGVKNNINAHEIKSDFQNMMAIDERSIPYEAIKSDIFNFKNGVRFSDIFKSDEPQISSQNGLDHPFTLGENKLMIIDTDSGRSLLMSTSYPCVVLYTHNGPSRLDLNKVTTENIHLGIAIEPQFMPNDINISKDKSETILRKEKTYHQWIKYVFN